MQALAAGAHEYVIKPVPAEAIVDKPTYHGLVPLRGAERAAGG